MAFRKTGEKAADGITIREIDLERDADAVVDLLHQVHNSGQRIFGAGGTWTRRIPGVGGDKHRAIVNLLRRPDENMFTGFVAEKDGQIIGFANAGEASYGLDEHYDAEINLGVVHPDHQDADLFKNLGHKVLESLIEQGKTSAVFQTRDDNETMKGIAGLIGAREITENPNTKIALLRNAQLAGMHYYAIDDLQSLRGRVETSLKEDIPLQQVEI